MANDRRRRRTEEEIHQDILQFLEEATFPRTTEQVADAVGLNWYAATTHLTKLRMKEKVWTEKVGKQNQWWPEDINGQKNKIRGLEKENIGQAKEIKKLKERITELKGES